MTEETEATEVKFHVRRLTEQEHPFVYSTALQNLAVSSPMSRHVPRKLFLERHRSVFDELLTVSEIICVTTGEDKDAPLVGYLIYERRKPGQDPILHYVYVKKMWRKLGVMKRLLEAAGISLDGCTYTHLTYCWQTFMLPRGHYKPDLAYPNLRESDTR